MPRTSRQLNLFAPAQQHSATSVEAAGRIAPVASTLRMAVLRWLRSRGIEGGTDEEGIDATALSPSTFRPRRVELVNLGLVVDSKTVRKTRSGRNATVWVAVTPRAKEAPGGQEEEEGRG